MFLAGRREPFVFVGDREGYMGIGLTKSNHGTSKVLKSDEDESLMDSTSGSKWRE